jgi:hypothetical protein
MKLRHLLHLSFILIVCIFSGCYYFGKNQYADVVEQPSSNWDFTECLTVISAPIGHNFFDFRTNIKASATPYYPSVVLAIQRRAQRKMDWSESEFQANVDALMKENNGLYIDWQTNRFVDSRGNFFKEYTQIDSLMFLISLINTAWTSANSIVQVGIPIYKGGAKQLIPVMVPLVTADQSYLPDISNIEQRIYLVNDKGKFIKPKYVWGRRNNILTNEETLFAMFYFREGEHHFLQGSDEILLLIKGFEGDIRLDFPLSMMR